MSKTTKGKIVKVNIQGEGEISIPVDEFDLSDAVQTIHGVKRDLNDNPLPGLMIGNDHYYRCLEIISIVVEAAE